MGAAGRVPAGARPRRTGGRDASSTTGPNRPGFATTVDMDHIKRHDLTHGSIDPTGIIPKGPDTDLTLPHGRG